MVKCPGIVIRGGVVRGGLPGLYLMLKNSFLRHTCRYSAPVDGEAQGINGSISQYAAVNIPRSVFLHVTISMFGRIFLASMVSICCGVNWQVHQAGIGDRPNCSCSITFSEDYPSTGPR